MKELAEDSDFMDSMTKVVRKFWTHRIESGAYDDTIHDVLVEYQRGDSLKVSFDLEFGPNDRIFMPLLHEEGKRKRKKRRWRLRR